MYKLKWKTDSDWSIGLKSSKALKKMKPMGIQGKQIKSPMRGTNQISDASKQYSMPGDSRGLSEVFRELSTEKNCLGKKVWLKNFIHSQIVKGKKKIYFLMCKNSGTLVSTKFISSMKTGLCFVHCYMLMPQTVFYLNCYNYKCNFLSFISSTWLLKYIWNLSIFIC